MRHIKEYEEQDLLDLDRDLSSVGLSDWQGHFITMQAGYSDGVICYALAIVGKNLDEVANLIAGHFLGDVGNGDMTYKEAMEEVDIPTDKVGSVEQIIETIEEFFSTDFTDSWKNFTFKCVEMSPKKLESSSDSADLMEVGKVVKMGRKYFTDFDAKILNL